MKIVGVKDIELDSDWTNKGASDVRWTELGLVLLITTIIPNAFLGFFWLNRSYGYFQILELLGLVLFIAGALLIVLGRKPFGHRHSNYAIVSISVLAVANLLPETGTLSFSPYLFPPGAFFVILTAVQCIPLVFLTYELQGLRGRILLWAAYAFGMLWSATLAYEGWKGPLGFLAGPISVPLTLAPSGVFAVACGLAYYRLKKRMIPSQHAKMDNLGFEAGESAASSKLS